jgi:hypothetical protein
MCLGQRVKERLPTFHITELDQNHNRERSLGVKRRMNIASSILPTPYNADTGTGTVMIVFFVGSELFLMSILSISSPG